MYGLSNVQKWHRNAISHNIVIQFYHTAEVKIFSILTMIKKKNPFM